MAVTLITGASSGLGYGLAPYMAADGDTVILTARRLESLQQLAEKIREKGGKAVPVALDVTDPAAVRAAVAAIERDHGPVDTLIANAGIGADTSALRWRSEDLERIYRTNVFGVSHCIEAVLPGMIARRQGHLVAVASLAGYRGLPASGAYASSKAAVISLMESLRVELRGHGVRVTTLSPGFVKTELTAKNRFPMPFLMELDDAARLMHRAIRRQKSEYRFPWTLASVITLARFLPNRLWDYLLRNRKVIKAE